MWKKEDVKSQGVADNSPALAATPAANGQSSSRESSSAIPLSPQSAASIGHGIRIKGEVTGTEDLFLDGYLEGKLSLPNSSLTVGPNGEVKADIIAREVIVRGRVDGKIIGREKIQLWSTGNVAGDLQTERLTIEDGAVLRGRVEIETGKPLEKRAEARGAAAGVAGKPSVLPVGSGSAAD